MDKNMSEIMRPWTRAEAGILTSASLVGAAAAAGDGEWRV